MLCSMFAANVVQNAANVVQNAANVVQNMERSRGAGGPGKAHGATMREGTAPKDPRVVQPWDL